MKTLLAISCWILTLTVAVAQTEHPAVAATDAADAIVVLVVDCTACPLDANTFVFPPETEVTIDQLDGVYGALIRTPEEGVTEYRGQFHLLAEPPYENGDLKLPVRAGKVTLYTSRAKAAAAGVL